MDKDYKQAYKKFDSELTYAMQQISNSIEFLEEDAYIKAALGLQRLNERILEFRRKHSVYEVSFD